MSGPHTLGGPWTIDNPLPVIQVTGTPQPVAGFFPPTVDNPMPVYIVPSGTPSGSPQPAFHVEIANPAATSSLTYVMIGFALDFTPTETAARSFFTADGQIGNTGNNNETDVTLVYGSGPAPANGDPLTGTPLGQPVRFLTARSGEYAPFSQSGLLENLTSGTAYWVDLAVRVNGGASILADLQITGFVLIEVVGGTMVATAPASPPSLERGAMIEEAPDDGRVYARRRGEWVPIGVQN
jgi:hypothetical protein